MGNVLCIFFFVNLILYIISYIEIQSQRVLNICNILANMTYLSRFNICFCPKQLRE